MIFTNWPGSGDAIASKKLSCLKSVLRLKFHFYFILLFQRRSGGPSAGGAVPERKAESLSVCDDSKSRPNNVNTLGQTCPSLPRLGAGAEATEPEPGQGQRRKPSLSSTTSLPLPQRSLSQGKYSDKFFIQFQI